MMVGVQYRPLALPLVQLKVVAAAFLIGADGRHIILLWLDPGQMHSNAHGILLTPQDTISSSLPIFGTVTFEALRRGARQFC
jgi:hypothetical protein